MFSEISKNWLGTPLETHETVIKHIRTTRTDTGLTVKARLHTKDYKTGEKVTDHESNNIRYLAHKKLPQWNYTIKPQDGK